MWIGALTLVVTNYKQVREIYIFAAVLLIQSLPFLAAVAVAAVEGTRFNSFGYWRALEGRALEWLPRPKAIKAINAIAEAPELPAENRVEAAQ